ncbi:MAG: molybdopterin-dependent oxidoreductase [Deltaproteobacteria bacterium]|nr:molybdopterin-dependent oxidoreductase [Deltaproteobacteria bacterium]
MKRDDIARSGLKHARLDQACEGKHPFSDSLIHHFSESVLKNETPPVDTLLVFAANPAYSLPDTGAFFDALKRIPFIVGFSPFRDETGLMADLVLPDHTYLEKREDIVWPPGLPYPLYGLSRPVVDPVYDTRHSGDVIIKLAEGIGASVKSAFPWKNFDAALEERGEGLFKSGSGLTRYDGANPVWKHFATRKKIKADYSSFDKMWEALTSGGLWFRPTHEFKNWNAIFKTPSGKFEFFSQAIEKALNERTRKSSLKSALEQLGIGVEGDEACMPHYEPIQSASGREKYPLLMIPYSLINLSSSWAPNPPYLNKTLFDHQLLKTESFADLNPQTATEYGLKQGDRVRIRSPRGELKVRVNLFEGAMPGIVYLPLGFGHWAYDKFQQDKGVNPNRIIDSGNDPISGQMKWWSTRVQLTKV